MGKKISRDYALTFPAIKGVQAGREYYVMMCPLKLLPTIFRDNSTDIPPELRAQREMNSSRIKPLTQYILDNLDNYVFSSIAASINSEVEFESFDADVVGRKIGFLKVPMEACFIINDGQHRLAAVKEALKIEPLIGNETISIVLYIDCGLSNSQQMFADLNRYAVRPTKSLSILYDHRDPLARLANYLAENVTVFKGMTEKAKSSISNRSRKLFTLSSIYQATKKFLQKKDGEKVSEIEKQLAKNFWDELSINMPDWLAAVEKKVTTYELRNDYIHAHGIALQALAIVGNSLVKQYPENWPQYLSKIKKINWLRDNAAVWEGRALIGGSLNKSQKNVTLTANYIKMELGLSLTPSENSVESNFAKGKNADK